MNSRVPKVVYQHASPLGVAIRALLPQQGDVLVQRDLPFHEHPLHLHPVDEVLLIVEGELHFFACGKTWRCAAGARIELPAHVMHESKAGPRGCIYVISKSPPSTENNKEINRE